MSCFFRIICSLLLTSNNLPIVIMQLMNNCQVYSRHHVGSNDDDTLLYLFYKDVVETLLPCPLEEVSLL